MTITISAVIVLSTIATADDQNVCQGKNIAWLQNHVPIPPQCVIESVSPINGMCEMILKAGPNYIPIYVKDDFVLAGEMFSHKKQITEEHITKLKEVAIKDNIKSLDEATAFTYTSKGAGETKKTVYMITDPLCPYCAQATDKIKNLIDKNHATLKTILYTVHGEEGIKKTNTAICKSFNLDQYADPKWKKDKSDNQTCERALNLAKKSKELAQKIGISGVPMFIFDDGRMVSGANMAQVEAYLKDTKLTAQK
jgi:thiol:disulfide interchange protein DsbC